MIEFQHVHKHYGPQDVLINAQFRILAGDRIGVVGPNGTGKTTLFGLINGEVQADRGEVLVQSGIRLGYLRQVLDNTQVEQTLTAYVSDAVPELRQTEARLHEIEHLLQAPGQAPHQDRLLRELGECQTRYEALGGYTLQARAESALGGLGFSASDLNQPLRSFSGGWQMRAELARVLIADPDILMLDEPSNYLDLPAVEWLQRYLKAFQGTLVLISHDRYLLNTLTQDTLEIVAGRCTRYAGPYDAYMQARVLRHEQLLARKKNADQKRRQVERFVERFRAKNTKATQVQSRIKMLEKMEEIELPDEIMTRGRIRLAQPPHCGQEIMRLEQVGIRYSEDRWILRGVDLSIQRGEKTALVGLNGLGKTTLLRVLAGVLPPTEGRRVVGHKVLPGYQTQEFAESMRPEDTVFATVRREAPDVHEQQIRTLLGSFGFSGEAIDKTVSVLSGGEKIRLAFARLLVKPPNFLILDEPTTHLDIHAREALEDALTSYEGTLYFVSHDVEFVRRVATNIIAMEPPTIRRYYGNYNYYRQKIANSLSNRPNGGTGTAARPGAPVPNRKDEKRARAEQVRERATRRRKLEKTIQEAEERIARLEAEQQALVDDLESADSNLSFSEINQRLTYLPAQIATETEAWESAAKELEELNS